MKVLVACRDSGSLKELIFSKGTDTSVATSAKPEEKAVLAAKGNPIVRFVVTDSGIIIAREKGEISLIDSNYEPVKELGSCKNLIQLDHSLKNVYWCGKDGKGTIYSLAKGTTKSYTLPQDISVAIKHATKPVILCSGSQLRPEIHCLETKDVLFQARNPKAKLDLEERNLVTNAVWLADPAQGFAFATITSHGKVRTYETAAGKKPKTQTEIGSSSLKAIAATNSQLVVGDATSKIGLYQISPFRLSGNYKGIVGGTNHLCIHKELVCAVGLDRYIRLFEVESRVPSGKIYVGEELEWAAILQDDDEKRELEDDELWQGMNKKARNEPKQKSPNSSEDEIEEQSESEISEYSDSEFSE